MTVCSRTVLLAAILGAPAAAAVPTLPAYAVHATRIAPGQADDSGSVQWIEGQALRDSPSLTIDDTLRSSAAFSLFRRSGSLTAHPTAQGVSLRGLGPSGASRSLVLLDGIPLNDPFGGWITWAKLSPEILDRIRIAPVGASSAWGSAALSGTIQLFSTPPDRDAVALAAEVGDFETRAAGVVVARHTPRNAIRIAANAFATDGFPVVAPASHGAVDIPADSRHDLFNATWRSILPNGVTATVDGRAFTEDRGNGTPLQRNHTRDAIVSATLAGAGSGGTLETWSAVAYAERESFSSFFSSVSADRSQETPANDQYDVPATAAGAAITAAWRLAAGPRVLAGADYRTVDGETRERYLYSAAAGGFTRGRIAGGSQSFAGAFVHADIPLARGWMLVAGGRADSWRNTGGNRREFDLATGTPTRDERFSAKDGFEFSPTVSLSTRPARRLRLDATVTRAFRVPTLNEYYRPFRVGPVSTEANPDLDPETVRGAELAATLESDRASLTLAPFLNEFDDAVTNVTLAPNSRQRRNLPGVRVRGVQMTLRWEASPGLRLRIDSLICDTEVTRTDSSSTQLQGKRLAQVPRETVTAGLDWSPIPTTQLRIDARWSGEQFEDDENALTLGSATTLAIGLRHRFTPNAEAFLSIENLLDERIETGRTADSLVAIAPPRLTHAGLRVTW